MQLFRLWWEPLVKHRCIRLWRGEAIGSNGPFLCIRVERSVGRNCIGNGGNTITFHARARNNPATGAVVYKRGEVAPDSYRSFQYSRENRKTYCWTRKGVVANRVERRYVFIRIREGNSIRKTRPGIRLLLEQRLSCFIFFSIYQVFELYELVSNYGTNEVRTTFDTRKKNVYKDTIMYLQFFFVIKMLIFRLKSILFPKFALQIQIYDAITTRL